ncbi:MAG TPA: RNA polymerase sigma factor [Nocardioidaceae bacterium]|nr:RNA polymerase sigma factor [Nocardioidaceae bacterium]
MSRHPSDDDLVSRAKKGDQDAWRELYVAHAGRLNVWLASLRLVDPSTGADDVAAEAWLTAARKITGFSGDSSAFAGWLFGIARNIAMNARRRSVRRATSPYATDAENTLIWGITEDASSGVAGEDSVRRLLARLPRREAETVACLDVVGLDIATTARALGISQTAVRVAHHRALGRLRKLLPP